MREELYTASKHLSSSRTSSHLQGLLLPNMLKMVTAAMPLQLTIAVPHNFFLLVFDHLSQVTIIVRCSKEHFIVILGVLTCKMYCSVNLNFIIHLYSLDHGGKHRLKPGLKKCKSFSGCYFQYFITSV